MVLSASIHWLVVWLFLASLRGILLKPLPQGTVTQSGEPSHFQVDDKAAEIEVNANPAGVKVNAKPASLQVVAKPGTPAIPVYHPAIHVAPHYLPPPIVHREPAMFYNYHHHHHCHPCCPPMCFGRSRGWFYAGLRRNSLPKPSKTMRKQDYAGVKRSWIPTPSDRDSLGRELDENGNVVSRSHKSSIPRPGHKHRKSNKRQYISGIPQSYQTQEISSAGSSGYAMQPQSSMLSTRAPLARNILPYGQNAITSYNALSNIGLGTLNHLGQSSSSNLGMYGGYGPVQSPYKSLSSDPSDYVLGTPSKSSFLNNFLQSEFSHELYGSSPPPSPVREEQGYSRSMLSGPLVQQPSGYGAMLSGNLYGGPYQPSVLGAYGNSAQGGLVSGYRSSPIMQLARAYTSQPLPSMIPGNQLKYNHKIQSFGA